jgi:hypothetical protein
MADKQIEFSPAEQQQIEAMVIDKDEQAALKYLAELVQRFKGTESHVCGTGPIK